jgi:hypothetical protein
MKRKIRTRRGRNDKAGDYRAVAKKIKPVGDLEPEFNIVLYGQPGSGKTTVAATLPTPILFIDCSEKGTDSVRDVKGVDVLRAETWEEVDLIYWFLKKGKHKYKSVVMDTVSQAQDLAIKQHLQEKGKGVEDGAIGNWGTMHKQDWGTVATTLKTFIISMRDLPLNVCFVAHDRVFGGEEDDEENVIAPSVGPRLMPSVATTLNGAVSIIGNTFIRERFRRAKKKGKKKGKERRIVDYCLRIGPSATYITKIRKPKSIELPDILVNPTYSSIMELIEGED